jgi:hypothetical protein
MLRTAACLAAVVATSQLARGEDGIKLKVAFGGQSLPEFRCASNAGEGFGTVALGGPRIRGSRLPLLTEDECLRACSDEETFGGVPDGKMGCCEWRTDGTCTVMSDARNVFNTPGRCNVCDSSDTVSYVQCLLTYILNSIQDRLAASSSRLRQVSSAQAL